MNIQPIKMPYATFRVIERPVDVQTFSELHDFRCDLIDNLNPKRHAVYYQADVDADMVSLLPNVSAIAKASAKAIMAQFSQSDFQQYFGMASFSNARRGGEQLLAELTRIFDKEQNRASTIRSLPDKTGGRNSSSLYLKLPRGVTLVTRPIRDVGGPVYNNPLGKIHIFDEEQFFYIRKAHTQILDFMSMEALQDEFSHAMDETFPFFEIYAAEDESPADANLVFTKAVLEASDVAA